jgi:thioredoxin-related protein
VKLLVTLVFSLVASVVMADAPVAVTNLTAALKQAKTEGKMLFVLSGRENCGNCQALKGLISSGKLSLPAKEFVYADVDWDDEKEGELFEAKFKVSGNMLPFVVVASADGKQLAARSGYGTLKDFEKLLTEAKELKKLK